MMRRNAGADSCTLSRARTRDRARGGKFERIAGLTAKKVAQSKPAKTAAYGAWRAAASIARRLKRRDEEVAAMTCRAAELRTRFDQQF